MILCFRAKGLDSQTNWPSLVDAQVTIVANHVPVAGGESGDMHCQGDMEKADMVDGEEDFKLVSYRSFGMTQVNARVLYVLAGIKESVCWTPPPEVNPNKTCEYQALCSRFKDLLTLPGTHVNTPNKHIAAKTWYSFVIPS